MFNMQYITYLTYLIYIAFWLTVDCLDLDAKPSRCASLPPAWRVPTSPSRIFSTTLKVFQQYCHDQANEVICMHSVPRQHLLNTKMLDCLESIKEVCTAVFSSCFIVGCVGAWTNKMTLRPSKSNAGRGIAKAGFCQGALDPVPLASASSSERSCVEDCWMPSFSLSKRSNTGTKQSI